MHLSRLETRRGRQRLRDNFYFYVYFNLYILFCFIYYLYSYFTMPDPPLEDLTPDPKVSRCYSRQVFTWMRPSRSQGLG